jgi:hypothetical protein
MTDHLPAVPTRVDGAAAAALPRRAAGEGLDEVVALTLFPGAVIVEGLFDGDRVAALNDEIDAWTTAHPDDGAPCSGNQLYDLFLGPRTVRLHGLLRTLPATGRDLVADPRIARWAERGLDRSGSSILPNADELIQIGPGESAHGIAKLGVPFVRACDATVRNLLGAGVQDGTGQGGGLLGLVDGRSPEDPGT